MVYYVSQLAPNHTPHILAVTNTEKRHSTMESVMTLMSVSFESGLLRAIVMKHSIAGYYINILYKVQISLQ